MQWGGRERERKTCTKILFHLLQLGRRGHVSQFPSSHMSQQRTSLWRRKVKGHVWSRQRQEVRDQPWWRMILYLTISIPQLFLSFLFCIFETNINLLKAPKVLPRIMNNRLDLLAWDSKITCWMKKRIKGHFERHLTFSQVFHLHG